jgi:hypothetical protein
VRKICLIARRSKDSGTSELHRTIAHPIYLAVTERKLAAHPTNQSNILHDTSLKPAP